MLPWLNSAVCIHVVFLWEYCYQKFTPRISLMQKLYTAAVLSWKGMILVNACHVHRQIKSAADRYKGSRPTESLLLKCNVMSWAGKLVEAKKTWDTGLSQQCCEIQVVTPVLWDTGLSQWCCEIQGCHNGVVRYRVVTTVLWDTGLSQRCCEIQGCHNGVVRYRVVTTVLWDTGLSQQCCEIQVVTTVLWDTGLSQQHCWRLNYSGIWCCVIGWVVPYSSR